MTTAPPHPAAAAAAAMPWHLAGSLASLKAAVDAHWPGRDKRSDGFIGDERHQAEGAKSDHNPWLNNCVRAGDFTATQPGISGVDGPWLAEQLRQAGLSGDVRLTDGGYVIWNHHITAPDYSRWLPYDGDPHTNHVHVSVSRDPKGYEYAGPWNFLTAAPLHPPRPPAGDVHQVPPAPAHQPVPAAGPHDGNTATEAPSPLLPPDHAEAGTFPPVGSDASGSGERLRAQYGNTGPVVERIQAGLNGYAPVYSHLQVDGEYGAETSAVIQDFQRRVADNDHTCPAEDRDALDNADGYTVGPATARAFARLGIHV